MRAEPGPPIFVVDRHGDALQYWQQEHHRGDPPFAVLHVDSHADMHLDWKQDVWTEPCSSWAPPPPKQIQDTVLAAINIMNFQPAAVYTRIVDAIVWLRSDFTHGSYNSPAPGHHRRLLGVPDYSRLALGAENGRGATESHTSPLQQDWRPLLWDWQVADGAFRTYGPKRSFEGRRKVLEERPSPAVASGAAPVTPPVEQNTLFEDRPRNLATGLPPAQGTGIEFDVSVVTRRQLEAGEVSSLRRVLHTAERPGHWVLDIDLDYFATSCPSLAIILRKHGWHSRESSMTFAVWATHLSGIVSGCLERECREDLFSDAHFRTTAQLIFKLGLLPAARAGILTAEDILGMLRRVHPSCSPPPDALCALAAAVNGLSPGQRLQWESLDGDDWHWVMQSRCPHYHASVPEIRAEARRLAPLLAALGPAPPALVTIARSSDGYLPDEAAAVAEWEVLLLVRRLWSTGKLQGGIRSLPVEAESCSQEQVAELLNSVRFHGPSPEGPQLLPRPWPFASKAKPFERVD